MPIHVYRHLDRQREGRRGRGKLHSRVCRRCLQPSRGRAPGSRLPRGVPSLGTVGCCGGRGHGMATSTLVSYFGTVIGNSMCASNVLMPTKCSCRSGADWRLQSDGMPDSRLLAWALFRWLGGSPGSRSPVTSRAFVTSRGTRRGTTSYRPPTTRCVCGGREGTGPTYAFFLEPSVPLTSVCNPLLFPLSSFLFLSPRSSIFFPFCFPFSCFLFLLSSFSYPLSWPDRPAIHRVPPPGHAPGRRREHRRTDGPAEQVARGRQAAGARL